MAPPPNTPSNKPLTAHARYQAPPPPPESTTTATEGSSTNTDGDSAPQHHIFSHPLSSSLALDRGTDSPTTKAAYIADLRTTVSQLQSEINVFLTARMEEDQRLAQAKTENERGKEKEEEENYGEEIIDDED